jgi:lysophospholipase L1-like esterase
MKKLILLFFIIAPMTWAQNSTLPANHPMIQYSGRIDISNPLAPRFDWPGVSITAAFHGTSIGFLLDDKSDNYDVILDGKPVTVWETSPDQTLYTLDPLAPGDHVVKIVKRTESLFGLAVFNGLVLPAGGTLTNPPGLPNRRLEVIGDSYVCGYGVESSSIQCVGLRPYENAFKAFGSLVAQDLQAEVHIEAFSGMGMVRNGGDPQIRSTHPFPPMFDRTVCRDEKSLWDFSKWVPNLVIVHLGINDFSSPPPADRKEFTHAYVAFLKHIRDKYPKAFIFCAAPLAWPPPLATTLDEIVEKRNSAGDKNIQLITYPPVNPDEMGCDGHPNTSAQRKIADVITAGIKKTMDW